MIATLSHRAVAARDQWSDPRRRARLLAAQINSAERRRVRALVEGHLHVLDLAASHGERMTGLDRADLRQAAYFGLRRAAETWDPTKRAAFGTWAYLWMRATVQEEVFRMRSTIRVPRRAKSPIPKCSSIDVERDDSETFAASIADEHGEDPTAGLHRAELGNALSAALGTLDPRDALVVGMRFGINGAKREHTFAEIAERLGVSNERARTIDLRARDQLRDVLADFAV